MFGLALAWALDGDNDTAQTGEPAPLFSVELLDGNSFDLGSHQSDDGRPIVLNLWASWCAPCRDEIPALSAFASANPEIAVIGVAVEDNLDDARALAAELEPAYPLGFGDDDFEASYPNFGLPVTYFIAADGTVIDVFNGILTEETLEQMTSGDAA